MSADRFTLAADLDPVYARAFAQAMDAGVEVIALACEVIPQGVEIARRVPVLQSRS